MNIVTWVLKLLGVYFLIQGLLFAINFKTDYLKSKETNAKVITMAEREKQLACLTKNIYFEAAQEPFEGKVAVAQVTINRSESGKFPSDICKVIYQKNIFMEKVVCQFSWYCETSTKMRPMHTAAYNECMAVAKKVLLEGFRLEGLTEAMYYHATYVSPGWGKEKIAKIGNHIFYK